MNRRSFLTTSASGSLLLPHLLLGKKSGNSPLVIGEGVHQYEVTHDWAKLPSQYSWQTTHNLAVDQAGFVYVIHEGRKHLKEHPSIFVFDPNGKFVRAFGSQFQGGGHGIEVRKEGNEEFLYVCAYQNIKAFAKLTLTGETVWEKYAPMDSGVYRKGEDSKESVRFEGKGRPRWGKDAFLPTNFAFLNDGGFLLADGYGSFWIHRYDKDGNWVSKFGGPGNGKGSFRTPHGIWTDRRNGFCSQMDMDPSGFIGMTRMGIGFPSSADPAMERVALELHTAFGQIVEMEKKPWWFATGHITPYNF